MKTSLVTLFLVTSSIFSVSARNSYPQFVPNVGLVRHQGELWGRRVGHIDKTIGGTNNARNPFGVDFAASGGNEPGGWKRLCDKDSDGDGKSNGVELGDPFCEWDGTNNEILATEGITHPGFRDDEPPPPSRGSTFKFAQFHGSVMIVAWLIFAPIGIMTAVFFKVKVKTYPAATWFKIHRFCLGTTVYLTLVAYTVMVYAKGEFLFENTHHRFGQFVVLFSILQPLNGVLRVHINKDGTKSTMRMIWEFAHQWMGRGTFFLAVLAIYFGAQLIFEANIHRFIQAVGFIFAFVGGGVTLAWFLVRTDERHSPELPTEKEAEMKQDPSSGTKQQSGAQGPVVEAKPVEQAKGGLSEAPQSEGQQVTYA